MMRAPGEGDRLAGPAVGSLELGNVGDPPYIGQRAVAREDPDEAVADLHGIARHAEFGQVAAEQIVRDIHHLAVAVIGPAVIEADQPAALNLALRQLELAMHAAILDRMHRTFPVAKERDRALPEGHLHDLARRESAIELDRIPVVRIEPRCPRLLAQIGGMREIRGRQALRGEGTAHLDGSHLEYFGRISRHYAAYRQKARCEAHD